MQSQNQAIADYPVNRVENGTSQKKFIPKPIRNITREKAELPALKVLMYHRIVEDKELSQNCELCVHVTEFRNHLEILGHLGYTPVTFKDLELYRQGKILLPKKPVIISFDDGYMDTYSTAYPLLLEFGMRAVVFVLGNRSLQANLWDRANKKIPEAGLMQNHHIKELHSKGFEIGAHSLNHLNLQEVSETDLHKEINMSRLFLESMIGAPVYSFSYPFGSVNSQVKKVTSISGYKFGCSVFSGPAKFGDDLYEIRRITIKNTTNIPRFIIRLKMPFEYAEWMWWKSKKVLRKGRNSA